MRSLRRFAIAMFAALTVLVAVPAVASASPRFKPAHAARLRPTSFRGVLARPAARPATRPAARPAARPQRTGAIHTRVMMRRPPMLRRSAPRR